MNKLTTTTTTLLLLFLLHSNLIVTHAVAGTIHGKITNSLGHPKTNFDFTYRIFGRNPQTLQWEPLFRSTAGHTKEDGSYDIFIPNDAQEVRVVLSPIGGGMDIELSHLLSQSIHRIDVVSRMGVSSEAAATEGLAQAFIGQHSSFHLASAFGTARYTLRKTGHQVIKRIEYAREDNDFWYYRENSLSGRKWAFAKRATRLVYHKNCVQKIQNECHRIWVSDKDDGNSIWRKYDWATRIESQE